METGDTQPIFAGHVKNRADAYLIAYGLKFGVKRSTEAVSKKNTVYIRELRDGDDLNWPDQKPWTQYSDDDFKWYLSPDGLKKKVLVFDLGGRTYHLVAYFTGGSMQTPSTDQRFLANLPTVTKYPLSL